ncbi:MAPEG family protein [Alteromonas oceanisediminis]|uniref:MAPEG family protein n=1 Tax=Alteromonas oceanisediminis TaxID=2836180 RepID=UPI001BDA73E0|nr:MAPEG family protein [Alteromonas oceanisediminis]MBT0585475.1 MAPEG family protein [Alteromonas oceanisediminis]
MAVMIISLLIVLVMPIIAKVPLAYAMHQSSRYDNKHPRNQQNSLTGFGARALAAHKNCFEAIAYFAPAVVTVMSLGAIDDVAKLLAIAFVISRFIYLVMYWVNWDILRSAAWVIGFGCALALLVRLLLAMS